MSLPKVLKNMAVFIDGENWAGEVDSVTLPTLGRATEEYRGNFDRPVDLDVGGTKLEMEFKAKGYHSGLTAKVGNALIDGTRVRFVGAYQDDSTQRYTSVEIFAAGRLNEADRGEQKVGEIGEQTAKLSLTYYREVINGRTVTEIDVLNHVHIVGGIDRLAEQRRILGI